MCYGQALEVLARCLRVPDKHLGVLVNHNRILETLIVIMKLVAVIESIVKLLG
jgi:hypothetical protein